MAFYIELKNGSQRTWHIQSKKPVVIPGEILCFTADGDELEAIIRQFKNIPYCYGFCCWAGEMAIFIYSNLNYLRLAA